MIAVLRLLALGLGLLSSALSAAAAAETVVVRAAEHDKEGFGRIAFDWPEPAQYEAKIDADVLTVHFARPFAAKLDAIAHHLDGYIASARLSEDGSSFVAKLKRPATLRTFTEGKTVAVDIIAARGAAAAPAKAEKKAAPASPAALPLTIRYGRHEGYRRVVLEGHGAIAYSWAQDAATAELRFARKVTLDPKRLAAAFPGLAPALRDAEAGSVLALTAPRGVSFRHFRNGQGVVIDILGDGDAQAPTPPPVTATSPSAIVPPPELIEPAAGQSHELAPTPAPPPVTSTRPPLGAPRPTLRPSAANAPPVPPGALPVHFALAPDGASLRFDWPRATAAAVFRRGKALWIVFVGAAALDLTEPYKSGGEVLIAADQIADAKATILRLVVREGLSPSMRRSEASWIVDLKPQEPRSDAPIAVETRPGASPASVFFALADAGEPLSLRDPEVGDTLVVVPSAEVGAGLAGENAFVDFRALASVQGLVIEPHADDLRVSRGEGGILVSRPEGLLLSSEADHEAARAKEDSLNRLFDLAAWRGAADQSFVHKRSRLEQAVAAAPAAYRSRPRLALARFYFAHLLAPEARGVLEAIARDDPTLAADPQVQLLTGAVELLAGDLKGAAQLLGQKGLDKEPEAPLWRASLAAESEDWPAAARGFTSAADLVTRYPQPLRDRFELQAAEALLATKAVDEAQQLIRLVLKGGGSASAKAMATYLDGERSLAQGNLAAALELWTHAAAMGDRPARARALYAKAVARYDAKELSRAEAIKALDALRFAWRGDRIEITLLRKLAELKLADGDKRGAFDVLRDVALNFPDDPAAKEAMKQLSESLSDVFLGPGMSEVAPLKALALFDEFKDYAPVGERGDAIVRRLVDRLVAVDLLDQAAALLEDQVAHRLAGRDKARVAAQLALLRLFDHKPAEALKALDIETPKDLPAELLRQRLQLRARALAELNRTDEALAILGNDTSRDADRLRADIYWRDHRWSDAAKAFANLVPAPAADLKIDAETGRLVLDWASALTLAGDQGGLATLRSGYGAAMAATPQAEAFRIIAGDTAARDGEDDPRAVAARVAQLGELQSFMSNLKQRLAKDKLSAIN